MSMIIVTIVGAICLFMDALTGGDTFFNGK